MRKTLKTALISVSALSVLAGCASTSSTSPEDPYEPFNRSMHRFNSGLDQYLIKPVTTGYRAVVPQFARDGVSNVYDNMGEPGNVVNNVLQGKVNAGIESAFRFMVNSTFGLLGLFDVASWIGMDKHEEDFGQTLGVWGVGPGPYLVLPVLGPTGGRDIFRYPVAYATNPMTYVLANQDWPYGVAWTVGVIINARSQLMDQGYDKMIANTVDEYVAVRDAYRRSRERAIGGSEMSEKEELQRLTPLIRDDNE